MTSPLADPRPVEARLRVEPYDRVAAGLVTALVLLGTADALALLIWLQPLMAPVAPRPETVWLLERVGGSDQGKESGQDKVVPGAEELMEFTEVDFEQLLEQVVEVGTTVSDQYDTAVHGVQRTGTDRQPGDPDDPGPGETSGVPPWERWELRFDADSLDDYARQLDELDIELGLIGGGYPLVDYVARFTGRPRHRRGKGADERRIYFTHADGQLNAYERRLARRAGVPVEGRIIVLFIPRELQREMLRMELRHATPRGKLAGMTKDEQSRLVARIEKTVFAARRDANGGFRFVVVSQKLRPATQNKPSSNQESSSGTPHLAQTSA